MVSGEELLGKAVIVRAFYDACGSFGDAIYGGRQTKETTDARRFLTGATKSWRQDLEYWCMVAGVSSYNILRICKKYEEIGYPSKKEIRKLIKKLDLEEGELEND